MGNWVKNCIFLDGSAVEAQECVNCCTSVVQDTTGVDKLYVDFEKVVPMPSELNIFFRDDHKLVGHNNVRFAAFEFEVIKIIDSFSLKQMSQDEMINIVYRSLAEKTDRIPVSLVNEFVTYGKCGEKTDVTSPLEQYVREEYNIQKYGYQDWYRWSLDNWGTKWNANVEDCLVNQDMQYLEFSTAPFPPKPVIHKLSELFPQLEISCVYCEEDLCKGQCGEFSYIGGECVSGFAAAPEDTDYRMEVAQRLWGREIAETRSVDFER